MDRPELLVFDVNETLLDLATLRPAFADALGSTDAIGEWFARLLHGSLVANHTGRYRPFGEIGVEALKMVASKRGIDLSDTTAGDVVSVMRNLKPHADVVDGLEALQADGYRMITLTNGSTDAVADQIVNAGLSELLRSHVVGRSRGAVQASARDVPECEYRDRRRARPHAHGRCP